MLAHPQLPPGLIEHCLDVLKAIMPFKRELIRGVVEGFTTPLFDPTRRANARDEMTAEEGARADLTVLERVHENFEDNATLEGFLADLIIPAVCAARSWVSARKGSHPHLIQSIAVKSLQLFLNQIQNAPEQFKFKLLQIVFDWTMSKRSWRPSRTRGRQRSRSVGLAGLADDPKILKTLLLAVSPIFFVLLLIFLVPTSKYRFR
ncbi:hypothetical protein B0H16DRAFT_1740610 [Mycena metata]|uniref:Nuclear condensin complex subunit 3 C-terminal domain-containing protein n=1 Tax=Mycena metata TaxID=1033252 RepID=A0AAD7HCB5_9AGAR|nr:hypothetical protein B0H16DRAFT_1740610 [Mycena metata]